MDEGADFFAVDDFLEIADHIHVEDIDWQVVVIAHADGGEVHDLKASVEHFLVGYVGELRGCWVFLRVGGVDAVNAGALEHHVGLYLDAAQARPGVGGEVGVAGAGREDADIAVLECLDGFPFVVELADGLHAYGRHDLCLYAYCAESAAEGKGVDDGGAHAHLVALYPVEAFLAAAEAAEDVAAADDDAYLHAAVVNFLNLRCVVAEALRVYAEALVAHEALAGELEQNAFESCHFLIYLKMICLRDLMLLSAALLMAAFAACV